VDWALSQSSQKLGNWEFYRFKHGYRSEDFLVNPVAECVLSLCAFLVSFVTVLEKSGFFEGAL